MGQQAVDEAIRLGDLHWCYFVSSMTADVMILLGRFEDARGLLREALAVRCVGSRVLHPVSSPGCSLSGPGSWAARATWIGPERSWSRTSQDYETLFPSRWRSC